MESLETFYLDSVRRDSREVRFGTNWRSEQVEDCEFIVFWVEDTREFCLLRAPLRDVQSDGVFSRFILHVPPHFNPQPPRDDEVTVEVIAVLSEEDLMRLLGEWHEHLKDPDGIEWIRAAVEAACP